MTISQALSEIGPRFTGTEANDRAADLLAGAFAAHGLEVERRPFSFTGWQLQGPAQLSILAPVPRSVPCATMIRSAAGRATGRLQPRGKRPVIGVFEWESYDVVDGSGRTLATIIQRDEPWAIPQCLDDISAVPMVVVGRDWLEPLGQVNPNDVWVELVTSCRVVADSRSSNVVATQPGTCSNEILVCAHYDTMYDSPGANDNASGVEVMTQLAAQYRAAPGGVTMRYVAFSGEEWLQLGSKAYLAERARAGDLSAIKLVLNIDMVGRGEYLWPSVSEATEGLVQEATGDIAPGVRVVYHKPPMRGDHYPFHEVGIPTVMLLWWPDEDYHSPWDEAHELDGAKLALSTRLAARITELASRTI